MELNELGVEQISGHGTQRFAVCMCDLLWMDAWARGAFADMKCVNSFVFGAKRAICLEIVLFGRMAGHGRNVGILYTPEFSVSGQNPAGRCFPEYTIPSRLL